mgnify:CR=1 FL=1
MKPKLIIKPLILETHLKLGLATSEDWLELLLFFILQASRFTIAASKDVVFEGF